VTPRIVFDTGALIALERRRHRMLAVFRQAREARIPIVVPTPVIAEWWRVGKGEKERERILFALVQEPPDTRVAKLAGAAMGRIGASVVDALVMAAASVRGDTVFTSDIEDLEKLTAFFPGVRVEPV
jgi:predicted nucleic acid-binding protein